jgi:hypothetical protein
MLRHSGMLFLIALLGLIGAGSAAADKPIKEPAAPFVQFFPPGFGCSFPMTWEGSGGFSTTHLDKDGQLRWIHVSGHVVIRVTNELTQESIDVNASGPGKITFDEAGNAIANGSGHWLVAYFPGDTPSSQTLLYRGNLTLSQAPDGTLTLVSYNGAPPRDICAELS